MSNGKPIRHEGHYIKRNNGGSVSKPRNPNLVIPKRLKIILTAAWCGPEN